MTTEPGHQYIDLAALTAADAAVLEAAGRIATRLSLRPGDAVAVVTRVHPGIELEIRTASSRIRLNSDPVPLDDFGTADGALQ